VTRRARGDGNYHNLAPTPGSQPAHQPVGHVVMFWTLLLMAAAVFAAAVLVPPARRYQYVLQQEQAAQTRVGMLEQRIESAQRTIAALQQDPDANEQLAKASLNYQRPGEQRIDVPAQIVVALESTSPQPQTPASPGSEHPGGALSWLVWSGVGDAFAESSTRAILMLLSAGVAIAAFLLYCRPAERPAYTNSG